MTRRWTVLLVAVPLTLLVARASAEPRKDITFSFEAGASRFTGPIGGVASSGGMWAVRLQLHPTEWFSYGVGYQGSANRVAGGGDRPLTLLVRDGANAFVQFSTSAGPVEPFVEAGVGVTRLGISGEGAGLGFESDAALELPLAAGARLRTGALTLGLKVGYGLILGNQAYSGGGHLLSTALIIGATI